MIAADKTAREKVQLNKNENVLYNDDIVKRRQLAVQYGREMKILQRRIAIHEGMLQRWEGVLIEKTGKLD